MQYRVSGINVLDLEKRKDYTEGDDVSRSDAAKDFIHDWKRLWISVYLAGHITVGQFVNLWRMVGLSSREGSQWMGRGTFWMLFAVGVLSWLA